MSTGLIRLVNTAASLTLRDQNGALVSLIGTTTTGLQEFVNLVASSGFLGRATGSGIRADGTCPAPFVLSSMLGLPPMIGTQIDIEGTIIGSTVGGAANPIIKFNTLSRCRFRHHGIIKLSGDSYQAINFDPTDLYPANSLIPWQRKEIYGSEIRLGNIKIEGGAFHTIVNFACGAAGFNNNPLIEIGEILGAGYQYGVNIATPDTANYAWACFVQNYLRCGLIDSASVACFNEGAQPIDATRNYLGTNLYDLLGITTGLPTAVGVSISGTMSQARIGSINNNANPGFVSGITFIQNSSRNYVVCRQTPSVNDYGTGNVVV